MHVQKLVSDQTSLDTPVLGLTVAYCSSLAKQLQLKHWATDVARVIVQFMDNNINVSFTNSMHEFTSSSEKIIQSKSLLKTAYPYMKNSSGYGTMVSFYECNQSNIDQIWKFPGQINIEYPNNSNIDGIGMTIPMSINSIVLKLSELGHLGFAVRLHLRPKNTVKHLITKQLLSVDLLYGTLWCEKIKRNEDIFMYSHASRPTTDNFSCNFIEENAPIFEMGLYIENNNVYFVHQGVGAINNYNKYPHACDVDIVFSLHKYDTYFFYNICGLSLQKNWWCTVEYGYESSESIKERFTPKKRVVCGRDIDSQVYKEMIDDIGMKGVDKIVQG